MSEHSKLSPSARHRWGACPGSVREEAKYPESPSGPAAVDGTHTHTLLEHCIKQGNDATKYIGVQIEDDDGTFVVDADRAERVNFALNYVDSRLAFGDKVIAEQRVHPDSLVHRKDMSGTVDIRIVSADGSSIEVIDYKDGMAPVEAANNPQLEQYAVGAVAEMQDAGELAPMSITMTIIQPKLRIKGMTGLSTSTITLGELMVTKDKMIAEAAATDAPDAPLVPGESQCKYCAHKGSCAALSTKVMADSGIVFKDISTQAAEKSPTEMTDEQILEIMESAPLLRQMIEAVEAEAQRRLEAGHNIAGLKLVEGRGSRAWMLSDDEMIIKFKKMGIPADAFFEKELVSPAKLEKATFTKKGVVTKLSQVQLNRLNGEYIKKTTGKPTVALASDGRKAVTVNAAEMFSPVEPAIPSWLS